MEVKKICYQTALVGLLMSDDDDPCQFLCAPEQLKSLSSLKRHSKVTRMIQNNSQTKFNQNQIKDTEAKKIHYLTALVGLLGRPENSCSHSKLILCCSLPNVTPHNKFHPNWMKNAKVRIFKIFNPPIFFEKYAKAKLAKLNQPLSEQ